MFVTPSWLYSWLLCGSLVPSLGIILPAGAQRAALPPIAAAGEAPVQRTRLYLKDGSYQVVLDYTISGSVVHYRSAERGGVQEDIPLTLVDLPRTRKWAMDHAPESQAGSADAQRTPVLSPELAREEADRAARTPFVATNLRLPDDDSVLALDSFHDVPELVPLSQNGGDLNKQTAHNVLRKALNPMASSHEILQLKGERADVQMHVAEPSFFVRLETRDDNLDAVGGAGFTVDTHGGNGVATPGGGSAKSEYVLLRLDVLQGAREVESFRINFLGGVRRQANVIEMKQATLPGGHWLKLTPTEPLEFGEYALVEVVDANTVNLGVWDFGVHPTAAENADVFRPEVPRKPALDRRPPSQ